MQYIDSSILQNERRTAGHGPYLRPTQIKHFNWVNLNQMVRILVITYSLTAK